MSDDAVGSGDDGVGYMGPMVYSSTRLPPRRACAVLLIISTAGCAFLPIHTYTLRRSARACQPYLGAAVGARRDEASCALMQPHGGLRDNSGKPCHRTAHVRLMLR